MKKVTKQEKQEMMEVGQMIMANVDDYTIKNNLEVSEDYIKACKRFVIGTSEAKTEQELVHEMKLLYIFTSAMYPQVITQ